MIGRPVILLLALCALAPSVEVRLSGPLCTQVDLAGEFPAGDAVLAAQVDVPSDAPADLQATAYALEDAGTWRQAGGAVHLRPGRNALALRVPGRPGAEARARAIAGLLFSSAASQRTRVRISEVRIEAVTADGAPRRILDLAWDGAAAGAARATTGQTWRLRLRPEARSGFTLDGRATAADGTVIALVGTPPAGDPFWSLRFTPPQPGRYRIELRARWSGSDPLVQVVEVEAVGDAPAPAPPPAEIESEGRTVVLAAPLRTTVGEPLADGFAACVIAARLRLPADAPDDLVVGAYAFDHAGRWRQSDVRQALRPGDNDVRLALPAGAAALAGRSIERGPGEAGLVLWSARTSQARIRLLELRLEAAAKPTASAPGLDRLLLDGLTYGRPGLSTTVGSTWSASVVPTPADGASPGLRVTVGARLTDGTGQSVLVPAVGEPSGRHRIDFHPSLPGTYAVALVGRWSDGRTVESPLPTITVSGENPCQNARPLSVRGPLATVLKLPIGQTGAANRIEAVILVPDGAPADLAASAVAIDHHDRWYQPLRPQVLHPGINRLRIDLDRRAVLAAGPEGSSWSANALAQLERTAIAFTTSSNVPVRLVVGDAQVRGITPATGRPITRLLDLAASSPRAATGQRWSLRLRPDPFPANPFDPDEFRLDLAVTTPEGTQLLIPGFFAEEMDGSDRGDREQLHVVGTGGFQFRYRPRTPGLHQLSVQATWRDGGTRRCALPSLNVDGAAWDGYVRIDRQDPRFFAVDGRFYWPVGPNLRSVWDLRSEERMRTRLTPDRGTLAYLAYLRRFAAGGANACEIWMSAWNLALEWRRDWPGFDGVGRYNQENAWRLDRILDAAWIEGMRVNLVINNHGQGSDETDAEWMNNPYNRAAGGELSDPGQLFHDSRAAIGQDKLRRYLIARYADHPAVLGWKLWTEINLTKGRGNLRPWHEQAARRWRELDPYAHPVATHWSGDYRSPDEPTARQVDYLCIDAYHDDNPDNPFHLVHRLLRDSTLNGSDGLARLGRPVLVTEFGGNWSGTRNDALMEVDHACGPWVGFVTGHAGAPMLWWFEWIDQGRRFAPYTAIQRFIAGEDPRSAGRPARLRADGDGAVWTAAWRTSTRMFGYAIDERWAGSGERPRRVDTRLAFDEGWPEGTVTCEWWDPDNGTVVASQRIVHPGGPLQLAPPAFRKHLAWKLK